MNLPNKLSLLRIGLVPLMVLVSFVNTETKVLGVNLELHILNLLFILASITDYLDGKIARKYNLITDFGKFIDPLADKIVVIAALIIMVQQGIIPGWIPIIVVFREFAVSGYRMIRAKEGEVIAASFWGKLKTATQMFGIFLLLLSPYKFFEGAFNTAIWTNDIVGAVFNTLASTVLFVSVIATIFSGYQYLKNMKDILKDA